MYFDILYARVAWGWVSRVYKASKRWFRCRSCRLNAFFLHSVKIILKAFEALAKNVFFLFVCFPSLIFVCVCVCKPIFRKISVTSTVFIRFVIEPRAKGSEIEDDEQNKTFIIIFKKKNTWRAIYEFQIGVLCISATTIQAWNEKSYFWLRSTKKFLKSPSRRWRSRGWMGDHCIIILSLRETINHCVPKNDPQPSSVMIF